VVQVYRAARTAIKLSKRFDLQSIGKLSATKMTGLIEANCSRPTQQSPGRCGRQIRTVRGVTSADAG